MTLLQGTVAPVAVSAPAESVSLSDVLDGVCKDKNKICIYYMCNIIKLTGYWLDFCPSILNTGLLSVLAY